MYVGEQQLVVASHGELLQQFEAVEVSSPPQDDEAFDFLKARGKLVQARNTKGFEDVQKKRMSIIKKDVHHKKRKSIIKKGCSS